VPGAGAPAAPLVRALEESGSHLFYVGVLAQVSVVLLPLTLLLQSSRVFGILGFAATSFFVPFAPIAWFAGQSHELRLRSRGVEPSSRALRARKMGILATAVLVGELVVIGVLIAALRLSGKMPGSFGISR
jgi:hypothetical protein